MRASALLPPVKRSRSLPSLWMPNPPKRPRSTSTSAWSNFPATPVAGCCHAHTLRAWHQDLHRLDHLNRLVDIHDPAPVFHDGVTLAHTARQQRLLHLHHLQHHDTLIGMQHHKVRLPAKRPDQDVVPYPGIVFETILEAFGETQFAACVEAGCAEGGVRVAMGWGYCEVGSISSLAHPASDGS